MSNMSTKEELLYAYSSCLFDFWGEEPTKRKIVQAWKDFLDTVRESEIVPQSYYTLTQEEKNRLYRVAGLI